MDHPLPVVDQMIDVARAGRPVDAGTVQRVAGTTLHETDDSNGAFAFYKANGVRSGAYTVGIDLRTPVPGGGATGGALLVLKLAGQCPLRPEVEARYGPLALAQVPRGRSVDEEAHWSRREPWGELSFGFASGAPNCLTSVVFTFSR